MEAERIQALVREAVVRNSRLRIREVRDDALLARDLGYDSFALLQLVLNLEDELGLEIDASRLANFRDMTYRQLLDLVAAFLSEGNRETLSERSSP